MSTLCLMMSICSADQNYSRNNSFVSETETTEDMQAIQSILLDYYRAQEERTIEKDLKYAEIICELFDKDNKQLKQEIDKLNKEYRSAEKKKEEKQATEDLKEALKGLRLDYNQIISMAKSLENEYAQIIKENNEKLKEYKDRALEIITIFDDKNLLSFDQKDAETELPWATRFSIKNRMANILKDDSNKFSTYNKLITKLKSLISEGTLIDQFLNDHPSIISHTDENSFLLHQSVLSLVPKTNSHGEIIFDEVRKALSNEKISQKELSDLVTKTAGYMKDIASDTITIQKNATDRINYFSQNDAYSESKLNNFSSKRYIITNLADKNPKFKDFDQEIRKLTTRLAYQIHHRGIITRFLYKEWRDMYYSEMSEFFQNAVKLAEKLEAELNKEAASATTTSDTENEGTNETTTDKTLDKDSYEYKNSMKNISNIKEIAKIGVKKIIPVVNPRVDSQEKIEIAIRNRLLKTRNAYAKNLTSKF